MNRYYMNRLLLLAASVLPGRTLVVYQEVSSRPRGRATARRAITSTNTGTNTGTHAQTETVAWGSNSICVVPAGYPKPAIPY